MKNLYIYPYRMGSRSAAALSEALDCYQIKHKGSLFKGSPNKIVINWGSANIENREVVKCRILNKVSSVRLAGNKLSTFSQFMTDALSTVPFTRSKEEAVKWLKEGYTVMARTVLSGHSGAGIVVVEPNQDLPNAPLYTKYIKKDAEYRIHVVKDRVVFSQRKIKDPDISEPKSWKIRSHNNGFIFQHNSSDGSGPLKVPEPVTQEAIKAVHSLGLDFGAVDVIWNARQKKAYLLEVNCAPGLEGATVTAYRDAFRELLA